MFRRCQDCCGRGATGRGGVVWRSSNNANENGDDEDHDDDDDNNNVSVNVLGRSSTSAAVGTVTRITSKTKTKSGSGSGSKPNVVPVLLEIVGAVGLPTKTASNSFVTVRLREQYNDDGDNNNDQKGDEPTKTKRKEKEIHRTKIIPNDPAPIWTVKTKSLCLINFEVDDNNDEEGDGHQNKNLQKKRQDVIIQLSCQKKIVAAVQPVSNVIPLFDVVGRVTIDYNTLVAGQGQRVEMILSSPSSSSPSVDLSPPKLAVRYRKATSYDLQLFTSSGQWNPRGLLSTGSSSSLLKDQDNRPPSDRNQAIDIEFANVSKKNMLQRKQKKVKVDDKKYETAYRVQPYPDPRRDRDETEFMTSSQIEKFMTEPSTEWVEAGTGEYGSVYMEILGADGLPNMDVEMIDGLSDPFVGILFEDTFVRTPVIYDHLNPRFPPWSQRAFKFNIYHPSSLLFVGVFDYDEFTIDNHDPIGRLVIHLDTFQPNTLYTLKYNLYHGDSDDEDHNRGSLTVRIRVDWNMSYAAVSKARSYTVLPRFIINTNNKRTWYAIRYLTRGSVDMTDASVDSMTLYAKEIIEHIQEYCYLFDVAASVLLWRGSLHLRLFSRSFSIWCPVDSLFLLVSALVVVEYPSFLPSIFLFSLSYGLLRKNHFLSSNPSPWQRVRPFRQTLFSNWGLSPRPDRIEPGMGEVESEIVERVEEYRMYRTVIFVYESIMILLQVYQVYSKTTPVDISTAGNQGRLVSRLTTFFTADYLRYGHMALKSICNYARILKNFVNWNAPSTYRFTVKCLIYGILWAVFPCKASSVWVFRILVWSLLGPWNHLWDIFFIRRFYRTREELFRNGVPESAEEMKKEISSRPNILEPLLSARVVGQLAESGRVVVEKNLKLRDFREVMFGNFSESIPPVDNLRYPSTPLPSSFAEPHYDSSVDPSKIVGDEERNNQSIVWTYVPGQKLSGNMIPHRVTKESDA